MSKIIFEPSSAASSNGWTVREKQTAEVLGSIEWHYGLGVFGFAAAPGNTFLLDGTATQEIGAFLDKENAD